jgi:hypothetical protein
LDKRQRIVSLTAGDCGGRRRDLGSASLLQQVSWEALPEPLPGLSPCLYSIGPLLDRYHSMFEGRAGPHDVRHRRIGRG